jgi:hypothetical protein
MAQQEFILYEQALELKELGFDESCIYRYCIVTKWEEPTSEILLQLSDCESLEKNLVKAPLYQQAFRWFREKGCLFEVSVNNKARVWDTYKTYDEAGLEDGDERVILYSKYFDTYEEAELECLKKLIEISKNERK